MMRLESHKPKSVFSVMQTEFSPYALVVVALITWLTSDLALSAPKMYFVHNDHLGAPAAITDYEQDVVWQASKTPFGSSSTTGLIKEDARFPGQNYDGESGLTYNFLRDYDQSTGRYSQSDPIGLQGGISTYGYALQNPIRFTDPTGEAVPFIAGCLANPACAAALATGARALSGAVIGGLAALNELNGDPCYEGGYGFPVFVGSLVGAASGLAPGGGTLLGAARSGMMSGFLGDGAGQISRTDGLRQYDLRSGLSAAGVGGLAGGLGNIYGLNGALWGVRAGYPTWRALEIGKSDAAAMSAAVSFFAWTINADSQSQSCECRM